MTTRDAGLLTIRALSIYAIIRALEQTSIMLYRWRSMPPEVEPDIWIYLDVFSPFLLLVILSLVLWLLAPYLSKRFVSTENNTAESNSISLLEAKSLVFMALGLYLLVDTISPLVQALSSVYASITNTIDPSSKKQVTILRITTVIKIAVGLWLVFGNKGIVNIIRKVRNE